MRRLYWKIFLSFWLTSSVIIISTVWVTGVVSRQASIPARERIIINNYAHAAIATYESGKSKALSQWMMNIAEQKHLQLYLISPDFVINSPKDTPTLIKSLQKKYATGHLPGGSIKRKAYYVSNEILTQTGNPYRLIYIGKVPITTQLLVPWADIIGEMFFAIVLSGLICYFLSHYLTKPIANLCNIARNIACGQLETRVSPLLLKRKDEIGDLSHEFNNMAKRIDKLVKAKERLLQDISHELRSPLARLQIAIALCQQKTGDTLTADFERMELEIDRLNKLIGEILSLAKLQDPNKKLTIAKVDLVEDIRSLVNDADFEFKDKNITIEFISPKNCYAYVDQRLIHRAIENIVRNSLKYTKPNSILKIELKHEHQQIIYRISDQGPGVPEQDLKTIFSAFYRVNENKTIHSSGYGIGLAISRKAIQLHNGSLSAENIQPHGLCVTVVLPDQQADE